MTLRIRPFVVSFGLALSALTCSSDSLTLPEEGLPAALVIVSGNGQTAPVTAPLPDSLVVRVTDSESRPVEGVKVAFTPTLGGGDAAPDTGLTNADGRAGTRWVLGSVAGDQRIQAKVVGNTASGALTQNFDATALAAAADTIYAVRGNGQSAGVGAPLRDSLVVRVADQYGNAVSGTTVNWAVAGGGTVSPSSSTTGAAGTAATAWTLGATPGVATVTATSSPGGLSGSPVTFTATAVIGSAGMLAITTQPSANATSSVAFSVAPVVQLQDLLGNAVSTAGVGISVSIASGPGGTLIGSTIALTNSSGRATFTGLGITGPVGVYTMHFSGTSLTGVTSSGVTLSAGAPVRVDVLTQPTTVQSGVVFPVTPTVQVLDAAGNPAGGAGRTISVASNSGTAVLSGTVSQSTDASGLATFPGLALTGPEGPNTLQFSSPSLASDLTTAITVVAGSPSKLAFIVPPSNVVAGASITPGVQVEVQDGAGNRVTNSTISITLSIASNPGASTLSGTATRSAVAGVATFPGLSLDKAGSGYTLAANATGASTATSAGFTVSPGAPAALKFGVQPAGTAVNAPITPPVTVLIQDALGNLTTSTAAVSVAFGANPGGATLNGTTSLSAVSGVATFSTLSVSQAGSGYTLVATSAGLASATSATFNTGSAGSVTTITGDAPDPSVVGQNVAVTFTVTSGGGTPTGNVTVSDLTTSCVATVAVGSCTLAFPDAGVRTLIATYDGDGNIAGSASAGVSHTVNKAGTTTVLNSHTPNPSPRGSAVSVTWTVSVTAPGAGTPTGDVTVGDGVNTCTAAVASGGCLLTLNTVGVRSLTAAYAGDVDFLGSASTPVSHTVEKAATTTSITSDLSTPSVVGQPVTVAFQVTSGGGTPAGTVTVSDGVISCNATVAVGNCPLTFTTAGPRSITATYAGNADFLTSASAPTAHGVNKAATTTGINTHTPNPSSLGAAVAVTWAVGVTAPGAGTPTGNVTVSDGVDDCTAAVGAGGCSVTLTTAGARSLTAVYAGDADFAGSTSPSVNHTVSLAATTTTITADTPDPSTVGQTVPVTFTVTAAVGTPTGNVTVSDGVGTQCVGTVAAGTCNLIFATAGPRNLVASYAGDVAFAASASAAVAHTVTPATTTTTIVSDLPDPSVFGEPVTVSFTVVSTGGTPTGNVTVSGGGTSCVATVAAGSCEMTFPAIGSKTLTANYPGDGNFTGSTSGSVGHTVNQASTTTAIADHTPEPSAVGAPVTVTWTVSPTAPGAGTPGGTVTVGDGVNTCNAAVSVGGCDITLTTVGSRPLTATYSGDASFTGSASSVVNHTVSLAASTTGLTSSVNPSTFGQSVTFTATVTGSGDTPTGTVQFKDDATNLGGPVALNGSGVATLGTSALSVASHPITAVYSGDGTYSTSTSSIVNQVVDAAATTTTISTDLSVATVVNESYTVDFSVTSAGGIPTGNVTVTDGSGQSCGPVALSGGAGSCSLTSLTAGTKTVVATYTATTDFEGSESGGTSHPVNPFGTATALQFQVQPTTTLAGATITPAVEVRVVDAFGNIVTNAATPIGLAIGTNPGAGILTGGGAVAPVSGVASFGALSIDVVGAGYTLTADDGALPQALSTPFDIN